MRAGAVARGLVIAAAILSAGSALAAKMALAPGDRIDVNRAPVTELMRLPGVGVKKAQAIVAYRQKRPFRRPEDVMEVKGLGKAWFRKVKMNLVAGAAPAGVAPVSAHAAGETKTARR